MGICVWELENILNIVPELGVKGADDRKELESHHPILLAQRRDPACSTEQLCAHHSSPSPPSPALVSAHSLTRPWWEYLHHRNSKHHKSGLLLFWKLVGQHLAAWHWKKLSQVGNNRSIASMRLERIFYRSNLSRLSDERGCLLLQKSNLKYERDSTRAGCRVVMLCQVSSSRNWRYQSVPKPQNPEG